MPRRSFDSEDEQSSLPGWISLAPFALAALAFLQAAALGSAASRIATVGLALAGVGSAIVCRRTSRTNTDKVWLTLGGVVCTLAILLAVLAPGTLNRWWAMNGEVEKDADPSIQTLVDLDKLKGAGRPMAPDEWADARSQAIRFGDDLTVGVESVKKGKVSCMGDQSFLLVQFRIGNLSVIKTQPLIGFAEEGRRPNLTDAQGHALVFREYLLRKRVSGPPLYERPGSGATVVARALSQDVLLVFDLPASPDQPMRLTAPAAAWERPGSVRFEIPGLFESRYPDKNQ
jgi:hypothetical protein